MPLVVPGLNSAAPKSQAEDWTMKLLGKSIGEKGDETTFPRAELPQGTRVVGKDTMMTMDHRPDRLNVHVDEKGVVHEVKMG